MCSTQYTVSPIVFATNFSTTGTRIFQMNLSKLHVRFFRAKQEQVTISTLVLQIAKLYEIIITEQKKTHQAQVFMSLFLTDELNSAIC